MGLAKRGNALAPRQARENEPQKDNPHNEKIQLNHKDTEKKSVQGNYEKNTRTQNI